MKIFVDTWGWIAISDDKDAYHKKAIHLYKNSVLVRGNKIVTSDFVLMETITALRLSLGHNRTLQWIRKVNEKSERGLLHIVSAERTLYQKAVQLLMRYSDKPDISLTDFTSFVIMQEQEINNVFTGDTHFEQVNLGFRLIK
ncbi:MAG: PIN domain-containing protein [Ignavibacteriales bacterium]|nr:PIN domain-containing protein [Ignavibacteriales bacterium]